MYFKSVYQHLYANQYATRTKINDRLVDIEGVVDDNVAEMANQNTATKHSRGAIRTPTINDISIKYNNLPRENNR